MGLSGPVQQALRHLYERWDGNGMPGELRGTQVPLALRLMQVAQDADAARPYGGEHPAPDAHRPWARGALGPGARTALPFQADAQSTLVQRPPPLADLH